MCSVTVDDLVTHANSVKWSLIIFYHTLLELTTIYKAHSLEGRQWHEWNDWLNGIIPD